jgi:hypothetical protein
MADDKGAKIDFFRDTWIRYLGKTVFGSINLIILFF